MLLTSDATFKMQVFYFENFTRFTNKFLSFAKVVFSCVKICDFMIKDFNIVLALLDVINSVFV